MQHLAGRLRLRQELDERIHRVVQGIEEGAGGRRESPVRADLVRDDDGLLVRGLPSRGRHHVRDEGFQ